MRILKFILIFIPVFAFSQAKLSTEVQQDFRKEMIAFSQKIETLSSDFTQTKHLEMMEDATISKGKLYYKAPNILKWEYNSPYDYKILFKGNRLFIDDEGDKSVTNLASNKIFEKIIDLISGSINGKLLDDEENFDISYYKNGNEISAILVPKDPSLKEMFSEITLIFNENHLVNQVKLKEDAGDYTEISFKNILVNKPIDENVFKN